jgi:DNA replication protein DnaC
VFFRFDLTPEPSPEQPAPVLFINANIPKRYWKSRLADVPDECPHKQRVARFVWAMHETVKEGRGIVLHGATGTGKTTLSCIILREVMRRGPNQVWFEIARDIDQHCRDRGLLSPEGHSVYDMMTQSLYVALDDLGAQRPSNYDEGHIERVIRERYNHQRPTIITTNLSVEEFCKGRTGLEDIIRETYEIVEVSGEKWR